MSSASGIRVSPDVVEAWSKACKPEVADVRALVLHIEKDAFVLNNTIPVTKSFKEDISTLPKDAKTCATYVYRTDDKAGSSGWHWVLITFVPDQAAVRAKMLHASSKGGLLKSLGEGRFKQNMFFTSQDDLTPSAFAAHLDHMNAPAPLSKTEQALAQIKISEAEEASARVARLFGGEGSSQDRPTSPGFGVWSGKLNPAGGRSEAQAPTGPAKGNLKWGQGVEEALRKLKAGHAEGLGVFLHVDPKTESVVLATSESEQPVKVGPSALVKKLSTKEPCYTFYSWPNATSGLTEQTSLDASGEAPKASSEPSANDVELKVVVSEPESSQTSKIACIYTCPPASPVRYRMLYSSSLRGLIRDAVDIVQLTVDQKLETSDVDDITESYLKAELFPSSSRSGAASGFRMPTKSASTDNSKSPSLRQPIRAATAISQSRSADASPLVSPSSASQLPSPGEPERSNSGGGLPESAFSMFGPRVQVGSPGGGGFARPRPAGRR